MVDDELLPVGTPVRVRCAHGRTAENLVWQDHGSVVMVCSREQFERLRLGYPTPMPIGFRREDVEPLPVAGVCQTNCRRP